MNGLLLLLPFLLIRFGLLLYVNKNALQRAAHFAPTQGNEIYAYYIYQFSNIFIIVYICFLTIIINKSWLFYVGLLVYVLGLIMCTITIISFANPSKNGLNEEGIYRISRNPMYVSYFLYFIGCVLLTQSFVLFVFVVIFQIVAHWIILAEERWCIDKFNENYVRYMKRVRRYI